MKLCIACHAELEDNNNFCQSCGAYQRGGVVNPTRNEPAYFLVALCVFTILGSLFGIARGWLYEMVSELDKGSDYYRGWIYALTSLGTLVAAVIMLNRKLVGLYLYTVAQIVYILTVISASIAYDDVFKGSAEIATGISILFLVPSIAFMILYWLPMNRKHLT